MVIPIPFHRLYVEQYGHPMLRRRHLPFSTSAQPGATSGCLCMNQTFSEAMEDAALRQELAAAFAKVSDHMRNR